MSNATCLPRETLKQYLVGGFDESRTINIELHLADCEMCERTIIELESDPDTLLESLRDVSSLSAPSAEGEMPSVIQRAVTAARQKQITSITLPHPQNTLTQIGAYDLLRPLGRGGMGVVALARHRTLQKEVAVKLLTSLAGDRADLVTRFQREIRTAGRLNHPAIVNATDAGQEQGTHYLVMEYIDGLDLSRIARLTGPMSIADACELMRQAAKGLSHAHSEGVVHRDIKPSNLMLDTTGHLKILDFGLAQLSNWGESGCELTTVGQLMGTLDYMAPEQAERSDSVDYRADLYALGSTLFRLLVGRAPLAAAPNMTLLEKVRLLGTQLAPSIASFRDDCPPELVDLVRKMLSHDPSQRPASAAHIAEALQPFCIGASLIDLLTRAQDLLARSPVVENASEAAAPIQTPKLQYAGTSTISRPPRRRWFWVALALAPLAVMAGILITLELQKGQLVIQSEVADVRVKVARDGQVVSELTIQPGAQSTRLRADKYEITIDSPSDKISLDKHQFNIKNGETVVATVKQTNETQSNSKEADPSSSKLFDPKRQTSVPSATQTPQATTALPATDATVPPRTLAEWLDDLERNRNMTIRTQDSSGRLSVQLNALNEVENLTDASSAAAVTRRLLDISLKADLELWSDNQSVEGVLYRVSEKDTMDLMLFQCLRRINTEQNFRNLLDSQLLAGEDQWTVRWFTAFLRDANRYSLGEEFRSQLFTEKALDRLGSSTRQCAIAYLFCELMKDNDYAKQNAETVVALAQKHLGTTNTLAINQRFYHGLMRSFRGNQPAVLADGEITVESALAKFAKSVFIDAQATPEQSAIAAARLATTTDVVDSWRTELVEVLRARLKTINSTPDRMHSVLPARQGSFTYGGFEKCFPATSIYVESNKRSSRGLNTPRFIQSEVIAYIALADRLATWSELSAELTVLAEKTVDSYASVDLLISSASKKISSDVLLFRYLQSPITLWPFEESVLQTLGEPLGSVPRNKWIEWAMFLQLLNGCKSDPSIASLVESAYIKAGWIPEPLDKSVENKPDD